MTRIHLVRPPDRPRVPLRYRSESPIPAMSRVSIDRSLPDGTLTEEIGLVLTSPYYLVPGQVLVLWPSGAQELVQAHRLEVL